MEISMTYDLIILPEQMYGIIKKIGHLNKEPILYGDPNLLKVGLLYYINADIDSPDHYDIVRLARIESSEGVEIGSGIGIGVGIKPKPVISKITITYHFEAVEPIDDEIANEIAANGFSIPEQELNTVRKIGRLFNKPIYTGDINLLDNGSYYYHKGFPFLTTVVKEEAKDGLNIGIMWTTFIKFKNLTVVDDADNENNINQDIDGDTKDNEDDADFTIKP